MKKVCWMCKRNKPLNYDARCKLCNQKRCVACGAELVVLIRFNDDLQTLNAIKVCPNEWSVGRLRPEWRTLPDSKFKKPTKRMKKIEDIFRELALVV